jgi:hypothetical protein
MSCPVSNRPVSILAEQCLEGAKFDGVVGGSVLPDGAPVSEGSQ